MRVASPADVQEAIAAAYPGYTTFGIRQHADGSFSEGAVEEVVELARAASVVALRAGPRSRRQRSSRSFAVCWMNWTMCRWCSMPMGSFAVSPFAEEYTKRTAPLILTPHPGEFARLTGEAVGSSDAERTARAIDFAQRYRSCAGPQGRGDDRGR